MSHLNFLTSGFPFLFKGGVESGTSHFGISVMNPVGLAAGGGFDEEEESAA
jgi:hypothetical protein